MSWLLFSVQSISTIIASSKNKRPSFQRQTWLTLSQAAPLTGPDSTHPKSEWMVTGPSWPCLVSPVKKFQYLSLLIKQDMLPWTRAAWAHIKGVEAQDYLCYTFEEQSEIVVCQLLISSEQASWASVGDLASESTTDAAPDRLFLGKCLKRASTPSGAGQVPEENPRGCSWNVPQPSS